MLGKSKSFYRSGDGVAGLEFALILPFMLLFYVGLIDLTGALAVSRKVDYAASVVADLVAQHNATIATADVAAYRNAAILAMRPTPAAGRVQVYHVRATTVTAWGSSGGGAACVAPTAASVSTQMTDGNDVIVAVVCTTFTPIIPTFLGKTILGMLTIRMSETIAFRPRQSKLLACTGGC